MSGGFDIYDVLIIGGVLVLSVGYLMSKSGGAKVPATGTSSTATS